MFLRKRRTILAGMLVVLLALMAFIFSSDVRWGIIGHCKGEAFFQNRPTTYWKEFILESSEESGHLKGWIDWFLYRVGYAQPSLPQPMSHFIFPHPSADSASHAVFGDDEMAIPVLLSLAKDQNSYVRGYAIEALCLMHPIPNEAIPRFIDALGEASDIDRRNAAWALGECGQDSIAAVPMLVAAIKPRSPANYCIGDRVFRDSFAHYAALQALKKIDKDTCRRVIVPDLLVAIKDENVYLRQQAIEDLRDFRDQEGVIDAIIAATKDPDQFVKREALMSLATLGAKCERAMPCIEEALKDKNAEVREAAEIALREQKDLEKAGEASGRLGMRAWVTSVLREHHCEKIACPELDPENLEIWLQSKAVDDFNCPTDMLLFLSLHALRHEVTDVRVALKAVEGKIGSSSIKCSPDRAIEGELKLTKDVNAFGDENCKIRLIKYRVTFGGVVSDIDNRVVPSEAEILISMRIEVQSEVGRVVCESCRPAHLKAGQVVEVDAEGK